MTLGNAKPVAAASAGKPIGGAVVMDVQTSTHKFTVCCPGGGTRYHVGDYGMGKVRGRQSQGYTVSVEHQESSNNRQTQWRADKW